MPLTKRLKREIAAAIETAEELIPEGEFLLTDAEDVFAWLVELAEKCDDEDAEKELQDVANALDGTFKNFRR
jgi:hypothetical protein